ncbi:interferon-induced very large GTPase 1-like [Saccostrea cucullata]|uniref:interferon-induced very large GTPase 1-like n=1 Tax=Saccostrea cuccullata TaxID=36930 RepID=UPI002ED6188C
METLAKRNDSEEAVLRILLHQLGEGESRFGYKPIQNVLLEGVKIFETLLRRFMEMKPKSSNEEKHQLWHGLLILRKKLGNTRHDLVGEISKWLQKYLLNDFVVLPCPFQDVESASYTMETIFLPAVKSILQGSICQNENFFQFLTTTLQTSVTCALDKLLSDGKSLRYLAMFSDAVTLGYNISTKEIKNTLTINVIKEYSRRCKKTLMFFGAMKCCSASVIQAWALKNIIFHLINKDCAIAGSNTSQEEKAKLFSSIIKVMHERGLKFETNVQNIVQSTTLSLDSMLKKMVQVSEISLSYFEGDKGFDRSALIEDFIPEHSSSEKHKPLWQILTQMDMTEFYPGKLTLQEVLKMHENQFSEPDSFSELPWVMLRKIIAINFDFREKTLHDLLRKLESQSQPEKEEPPVRKLVSSRKPKKQTREQYHPADIFLAIFQCFDSFLKRLVVQKMQVCQVAIPLVYQDYERELLRLSLWPIREIFIDGGSESVATKQLRTVAFIGIGDNRKGSKSKLINQFLRSQNDEHSTFFHKDCLLGFHRRVFASGTIEASWYIPKSKTSTDDTGSKSEKEKTIEWPLTVLNLRGNAFTYPKQLQFLLNLASALVVIIDYEDIKKETYYPILKKIHASEAHVIIVTDLPHDEDETEHFIQIYEENTELTFEKCSILSITSEGRYLNEIEVKQFLINDVYDALQHSTFSMSLEEMSEQLPSGFYSDEELPKSLLGKQLCDQIVSQIEGTQQNTRLQKHDILPLQGEALWHEWSNEQKEGRRSGKREKFNANDPHLERMRILRVKQVCVFNQINDIMAQFVDILVTCICDKETTLFFLSWLRQYMDSRSRIILPKVLNRLRRAFYEFESIRSHKSSEKESNKEIKMIELKSKISEEERNLAHSSFGLEHFFREMGQIYEAFMYCQDDASCTITMKSREILQSLPKIAAKLLVWGQPLEVMDGDAANVPLKWINAVYTEVSRIIGRNKRLFAISVLGIQSSGKSTLLNTMFGLQFAVSAGRCTRGIYIQLVPIDKTKSSLKFDYAMIIDTEGLRAPELAGEKVNHDNELATLVIGMGDVSIINIKGETIADMEDVLQIVVHALIRLKQANEKITLKQSCIFVHQNVSAQDADKLTIQGNQKIVNNLDKMTVEVATEEHVANIRSFQDVIGFDPIRHVKYIPDLWHGSPPMAPASSQYSTSVIEVAKCILIDLTSDESHNYLSVENTKDHLQSLWNGILSENFVFSFRNVLEVKAYSLLEKKFQELTWQLDELKLKWLNDSVRPKLRKCIKYDELDRYEREIYEEFSRTISSKTKAITEELELFFKESDLAEHMVHWKGRKNAELESTSRAIISDIKHKLNIEKEKCKTLMDSNNCILKNKKEIQGKATDFAKTLKGRKETPSEEEISKQFDQAWKQWVDDIVRDNPERDVDLDVQEMRSHIVSLLYDRFRKYDQLVEDGLKAQNIQNWRGSNTLARTMAINDIKSNHITIPSAWAKIKNAFSLEDYKAKAYHYISYFIFSKIDTYIKSLPVDNEYDTTIFSQILKYCIDAFQDHFRDSANHGYTITHKLEITVVLHVARFSVYHFTKMIRAFKLKNSIHSRIESSRQETEALFIGICTAKANEVIVSNVFCLEMKPLVHEKIEWELSLHISREINHLFEFRKYPLIKAILKDLAEDDDFDKFMQYVTCCESYARNWISEFTKNHFSKQVENGITPFKRYAIEVLEKIMSDIKISVRMASCEPQPPTSVAEWIKKFLVNVKDQSFHFSAEPFQSIKDLGISNFDDLSSLIKEQIDEVKRELTTDYEKRDIKSVSWKDPSPYQVIIDKLWGCPQTCPWCKEPCSTASRDDNHDHSCIQHRPQGVNGYHWIYNRELVLETCNFLINSERKTQCSNWCTCSKKDPGVFHPYKSYKTYMPGWEITPSTEISKYWSWFIGKYGKTLAGHHKLILPEVSDEWVKMKKENAILSLSEFDQ